MTHQPAISFSNSFHFPFNRAGGRSSNVMQRMNRLYIIGNGFDIYHRIPSSFSAFRSFVEARGGAVWEACENFLPANVLWSDLEAALGTIDTDYLLEDHQQLLVPYGADDWSDASHHDYEWAINETTQALSSGLLGLFTEWVSNLSIPFRGEVDELLEIEKNSKFISFNYTETLMKVYGVDRKSIFFPHGFIDDEPNNLILGHAWVPEKRMADDANEDTDTRLAGALNNLDSYFKSTFKPSSDIISGNSEYFNSLSDVDEVFVLGHSLADVDHPYFSKIISSITPHAFWVVCYFVDPEPIRKELAKLGVCRESYRLVTLSELQNKHHGRWPVLLTKSS